MQDKFPPAGRVAICSGAATDASIAHRSQHYRGLFPMDSNIRFMSQRRAAAGVSMVLVVCSLLLVTFRGLNFGLDFTGGTLIEVRFAEPVPIGVVRQDLAASGFAGASVQQSGSDRDVLIRVAPGAGANADQIGDRVAAVLAARHPDAQFVRAEFVGPAVGDDLRESGILAMLAALTVIGGYIAWRFTGKFAVAATIALIHDVILTLGAFALFRWTFDLPSLAAVLTVIGYSLNDTIVVCDRIRENLRSLRRANLMEVIDRSLNQTLERTLVMSGTTLAVLLALLFFGGEALRGFSAALTVGVVVGTYSSIYVAAAYLVVAKLSPIDLIVEEDAQPGP